MSSQTAKLRFFHFIPAIALFILIYILLTLPGNDIPKSKFFEIVYFDKWVHTGLFAALVFLFCYPFKNNISYKNSFYLLIVLFAIVYGVAMEYVQKYFTKDRSFDVTDMMADTAGAILGYFFFRYIAKKVIKKNKPL